MAKVLGLAMVCAFALCTPALADVVTIDYDFRGPQPTFAPGEFGSLNFAASNIAPGIIGPGDAPMITATADAGNFYLPDIKDEGDFFNPNLVDRGGPVVSTNDWVSQSITGLGVSWDGTWFRSTEGLGEGPGPIDDTNPNEIENFGAAETLNLEVNSFGATSNVQLSLARVTLTLFSDTDIFLNNVLIGTFNPAPTILFPVEIDLAGFGITLNEGDVLSFRSTTGEGFAVSGLQLTATVPEPAALALTGLGVLGFALVRRRRRRG